LQQQQEQQQQQQQQQQKTPDWPQQEHMTLHWTVQ
jgi:hypothetical protein